MQFGILVKNLFDSELNWRLISQTNNLCKDGLADIIYFYEDATPQIVHPMSTIMQAVESYEYTHPLIATNLSTAQKLLNFPRCSKRIFYIWDLEWIRFKNDSFHNFRKIYTSDCLELVCRTEEHKKIIETIWKVKVSRVSPKALLHEIIGI